LAHHLRSLGVKPETRVGIYLERSLEAIIGILAILKAGGIYVPLDPAYPQERLSFMLEDAGVEFLIKDSKTSPPTPLLSKERGDETSPPTPLLSKERGDETSPPTPLPTWEKDDETSPPTPLPTWEKGDETSPPTPLLNKERGDEAQLYRGEVINIDTDWEIINQNSVENPINSITPENLAYIMYTSGSTGIPKGVCTTHRGIVRLVKSSNYVNLSAEEIIL
ncbi:MAG: AMP-binding protein, partial [Cyanobacteria bacterium J06635_10]